MSVVTTLNFLGRTEEALNFYRDVLDAETIFLMRFRDCPDSTYAQPNLEQLIFHATFRVFGTEFMASDVGYKDDNSLANFAGFALAIRFSSKQRAMLAFNALADGGQILYPLSKSAFTSWYGIVKDRFGVSWKVSVDNQGLESRDDE